MLSMAETRYSAGTSKGSRKKAAGGGRRRRRDVVEEDTDDSHTGISSDEYRASYGLTSFPDTPRIEPYKIAFKVPCGQALREVQIWSTESWARARKDFAQKMDCESTLLRLAYVLPWEQKGTKKLAPTLLQDADEWDSLKDQIDAHVRTEKAKKGGRGMVKPFSIVLSSVGSDGMPIQVRLPHIGLLYILITLYEACGKQQW